MKKLLVFGAALAFVFTACNPLDLIDPLPNPHTGWEYAQARLAEYVGYPIKNGVEDKTAAYDWTIIGAPLCAMANKPVGSGPGPTYWRNWETPAEAIAALTATSITVRRGGASAKVAIETTLTNWRIVSINGVDVTPVQGQGFATVTVAGTQYYYLNKMLSFGGLDLFKATRFTGEIEITAGATAAAITYVVVVRAEGGKGGWIDLSLYPWLSWLSTPLYANSVAYTAFRVIVN